MSPAGNGFIRPSLTVITPPPAMSPPSNIEDLGFTDDRGRPARRIIAFPYGEEKNGARFQIFRLGWFAPRPGTKRKLEEVVVLPDFIYLPCLHKEAIGRFVILRGGGFVSRGNHWSILVLAAEFWCRIIRRMVS